MRLGPLLVVLFFVGVLVLTNRSFRQRQIMRRVSERVEGTDRYVDIGVCLRVVAEDPNGEPLLESQPGIKHRVIRTHHFGGMLDTKSNPPRIVGPSQSPQQWLCSEDQERIILHDDPAVPGQLVYGSEGAGKTTALVMWHYVQWLRHLGEGREGGQTAPTTTRIDLVLQEFIKLFRRSWYHYAVADQMLTLCDGTRIRLKSTYRQSAAQGSPIQGFNWSWCGRDETQDQVDVHEDIESRGRSSKGGIYPQLGTATAKDDPDWRTLRETLIASGKWVKRDLSIFRSPFIGKDFLATKAKSMTSREFRRRYGDPITHVVEDLAPENQLYFAWSRGACLKPAPRTWQRITGRVIQKRTDSSTDLLAGHDPGAAKGATVYLDCFLKPGTNEWAWWVRGERMHKRQTIQRTARDIKADSLERFKRKVHVRAMPVGQSEDRPSMDMYRIFRAEGVEVLASQYKKDGTGTGVIKKEDRIELVNWLFEQGRLFIDVDELGQPVAPMLVKALELMERDGNGRAETGPKDESDLSDCPAALGYALWPFEKSSAGFLHDDTGA